MTDHSLQTQQTSSTTSRSPRSQIQARPIRYAPIPSDRTAGAGSTSLRSSIRLDQLIDQLPKNWLAE